MKKFNLLIFINNFRIVQYIKIFNIFNLLISIKEMQRIYYIIDCII